MQIRVAVGRERVVRDIRASAALTSRLAAPATARAPWLTAVAHATPRARPRAVVVEHSPQGRPAGAALLSWSRRGRTTEVRLLGDGAAPAPPGSAPRRLLAPTPDVAALLADGLVAELAAVRGPWRLSLTGLPLGDPTLAAVAQRLGTGVSFATTRSRALVDGLSDVGPVTRSRDAAALERWLPRLLEERPAGSARPVVRALARVHAAAGVLEHAVVRSGDHVLAGLLTLVDGDVRRPWWGFSEIGGLAEGPGQPLVSLTATSSGVSR